MYIYTHVYVHIHTYAYVYMMRGRFWTYIARESKRRPASETKHALFCRSLFSLLQVSFQQRRNTVSCVSYLCYICSQRTHTASVCTHTEAERDRDETPSLLQVSVPHRRNTVSFVGLFCRSLLQVSFDSRAIYSRI